MPQKSGWGAVVPQIEPAQRAQIIEEVAETFKGRPLDELRQDTEKLVPLATQGVLAAAGRLGIQISEAEIEVLAREVVARVGGLGFLAPLLRLESGMTEIAINPDGSVWVVPKGRTGLRAPGYPPNPERRVARGRGPARAPGTGLQRSLAFSGRQAAPPGRSAGRRTDQDSAIR